MTEIQQSKPIIPSQVSISCVEDENSDDASDHPERIPFSKCTHHNKYLDSDKQTKLLNRNKENRESPKRVSSPRSKLRQPLENADSGATNTPLDVPCDRPVTPTPEASEAHAPLTPTANLKMLFSAVSPELRNREKSKELFSDNKDGEEESKLQPLNLDSELAASQNESDFSEWKPGSRKEKSLGLLCQKFLSKYPRIPSPDQYIEISLDEISKDLCVERRRIYDIVNVLESVEIVSRVAKNKYAWHGKTNLVNTLAKLKALGEAEGFAEQILKIKDYELTRELDEQNGCPPSSLPPFNLEIDNPSLALMRKDKSLGIMSQKFLMLFLVSKPRIVNLDLAAKILIGDPNIDRTENAKFKTKIRRLYDIANILTSLHLIHKVHVLETRGRKPAFKYTGPDVDANDINVFYNDGYHRPSSRHSMLDCVKNNNVAEFIKTSGLQPIKSNDVATSTGCGVKRKQTAQKSMPRHSSFDQICQVAETERKRLYASMSQPASPTEQMSFDDFPKSLSQEEPAKLEQKVAKSLNRAIDKQFYVVKQGSNSFQVVQQNPQDKIAAEPTSILEDRAVSAFVPMLQSTSLNSKEPGQVVRTERIIIKTKQPASMPLTKDQIDAVLKSLKVPVPVKKNEENKSTSNENSSDCVKTVVEKTPENNNVKQLGNKRSLVDQGNEQQQKRFRIDFPSPPTDDDEFQPRKKPDGPVKFSPKKDLIPELMNAQSTISTQNLLSSAKVLGRSEMDLAVPFPENSDLRDSISAVGDAGQVGKISPTGVQRVAVQFPNQEPTILQLPFVQMQTQNGCKDIRAAPHPSNGLGQPMKIIPMSATGVSGQPINFMVPVTFSPPLTPSGDPTSPNIFTFPSQSPQNMNYTSMQLLQPTAKYPNVVTTACPVVHSSPSPSVVKGSVPQLVTPTERPLVPPAKFFGNTPGGLIPLATISAAAVGGSTKEIFPTARKLDLPDISS